MSANRSIKISWAASHYVYGKDDGVRVRFNVVCATGMATKIFAYRLLPLSPQTGAAVGTFSHVCSPPDIEEYPEDGPTPASSPEWFRLSYVDVLLRSVEEAEDFIAAVRSDVYRIKRTLDKMDTVFPDGEDVFGADCDPDLTSSSSADSGSLSSISLSAMLSATAEGTTAQSVGGGVAWEEIGTGSGSPVLDSDSAGLNRSRVALLNGETSQLLLVQGFDFSALDDDAIIEGISALTVLRDATTTSESSTSSMSSEPSYSPRLVFLAIQHPEYGLGSNAAVNDAVEGPAWQSLLHGGSSDMWGLPSMTGKDLKRGAFGMSIVVLLNDLPATAPIEVDGVELTVYYREVV